MGGEIHGYEHRPHADTGRPHENTAPARLGDLVIPLAAIFLAAVVIALVLPPVYKAGTTILIEQQDVPIDFVKATVSTYAEQQMQIINQRIMSSTRLLDIINRFNLATRKTASG